MGVWYCTREDVKSALDFNETARNNGQIDRAIASASRSIEGLCRRVFYPQTATRYFDWPNEQTARSYRLWLNSNEVISVSALTSGGVLLDPADYDLRRSDDLDQAPYTRIEIDLSGNASFSAGSTFQRSVAVTGLFGYRDDETPLGVTVEALDASETGVDVDGPTAASVGVGSLLRIDDERLLVTGRSVLDTGQNLQTPVEANKSQTTIAVADASGFSAGEVILLDAERMLIADVAGTNLIVQRAWDGTPLAAHTGSDVYAYRTLTVTRAGLGTTAASHTSSTPVLRFDFPGLVRELCVAEAVNALMQESSGFARLVGSGDNEREMQGKALRDIRQQAVASYGRLRIEAV
ncbi:hypothetical protein ABZ307_28445 [Streptomyces griseorubiginosus]|uniref:hypothetical protein n=1 Tax=Streptomyces griseorubiginosus TaxID=67304 RepID=UPI0033AD2FC1